MNVESIVISKKILEALLGKVGERSYNEVSPLIAAALKDMKPFEKAEDSTDKDEKADSA